jgi:hypothetical protein
MMVADELRTTKFFRTALIHQLFFFFAQIKRNAYYLSFPTIEKHITEWV